MFTYIPLFLPLSIRVFHYGYLSLIRPMKKPKAARPVVKELSVEEIEKILQRISKLIKSKRKTLTTLEDFSYEVGISRSAMAKYEAGADMYLTTFFKLIHGLNITPEEFYKALKLN